MAGMLGLLALLAWSLNPRQPHFKPAPLEPASAECPKLQREFLATNITELPGTLLDGFSPEQRLKALYRLNTQPCPCGCSASIASCRIENPSCEVSKSLAEKLVAEVRQESVRKQ